MSVPGRDSASPDVVSPGSSDTATRRELLARSGAALVGARLLLGGSLFLGLESLLGRAPEARAEGAEPTAALQKAVKVMNETKSYGVAILVPEDEAGRKALGAALERLMPYGGSGGRGRGVARLDPTQMLVLLEVVYVCAPATAVDGAEAGKNVVLLDADGKKVAATAIDFAKTETVVGKLEALIRDEGRAAARAKLQRTKAIEEVLATEGEPRVEAIRKTWSEGASVYARAAVSEPADRAELIFRAAALVWAERVGAEPSSSLPFGVSWKLEFPEAPKVDPCPPCGMALMPGPSRKFVDFLTAKK